MSIAKLAEIKEKVHGGKSIHEGRTERETATASNDLIQFQQLSMHLIKIGHWMTFNNLTARGKVLISRRH
jgi:hypothetical protein